MNRHMNVPMTKEEAASLKAGDYVYLTGTIYTARDAAHKRMDEALDRGESLPFDIEGSIIYYMGPSPAREGRAMIGKGKRSKAVMDSIVCNGAVYFAAVGGAGAILSKCILSSEIVAYEDLGTEAVRRLAIQDFPVVVVMDALGNNLYETAVKEFCTL